jgi:SHS2 domain-containing protein
VGFEYVDHTADVAVRAWGNGVEEAFSEAARGLFAVMITLDRVAPHERFEVSLKEKTLEELLVEWLAVLLAQKEISHLVFSRFDVAIRECGRALCLSGAAWGEPLDVSRHEPGCEVKGVGRVGLHVQRDPTGWSAQFVLDV